MARRDASKAADFLPLKPVWFQVLVTLADQPTHGYAIRQAVAARTDGRMQLWPTTLYGTLGRLQRASLIEEATSPGARDELSRRTYRLTPLGRDVLVAETRRLADLLHLARAALSRKRAV